MLAAMKTTERALASIAKPLVPASFPLGRAWFVVCVMGRNEHEIAREVDGFGFGAFYPVMSRSKVKRGRRVIINDPLFPGYLFAHFDREKDDWGKIEDINGVISILRNGLLPSRVPDNAIEHLRNAEAAGVFDYTKPGSAFREGESVEITEGPFAGLIAKVRAASPKKRVKILLDTFGKIEIDPGFLRKV